MSQLKTRQKKTEFGSLGLFLPLSFSISQFSLSDCYVALVPVLQKQELLGFELPVQYEPFILRSIKMGKLPVTFPPFKCWRLFENFLLLFVFQYLRVVDFFFFNFFIFSFFGVLSKSIGSLIFRSSLSHTNSRTSIYYTFRSIYYTYISLII